MNARRVGYRRISTGYATSEPDESKYTYASNAYICMCVCRDTDVFGLDGRINDCDAPFTRSSCEPHPLTNSSSSVSFNYPSRSLRPTIPKHIRDNRPFLCCFIYRILKKELSSTWSFPLVSGWIHCIWRRVRRLLGRKRARYRICKGGHGSGSRRHILLAKLT